MAGTVDSERDTRRTRTETVEVLLLRGLPPLYSPSLPIARATGWNHPDASQGETEQGTSRLVQNTTRIPPPPFSGGGENAFLKGQHSKTRDKLIP